MIIKKFFLRWPMALSMLQIIVILFIVFAWSRAILRLRDRKILVSEFIFWTVIWAAVITTALLPKTADIVSDFFGVSRPIDLAIYLSILLLLYLVFRLYVKHEQQQQTSFTHDQKKSSSPAEQQQASIC